MPTPFDIAEFIDKRRVGFYQARILITCLIVMVLDGFDMQVIGIAIPALAHNWGLTPKQFGMALTAGPVGMLLGAAILGPIADRYGRRRPVIAAVTLFGLATLGSAYVSSPSGLAITRLFTGLGLGGVLPNIVALSSEYVPGRSRGTLSTLTYTGVPIGALLSGLIGTSLIPVYGWQSVFFVGGLLPLVIAVYAIFALPESIRFIAARTEKSAEVAAVIQKIAPEVQLPPSVTFTAHETRPTKAGLSSLFGPGRTPTTVLLTLVFVCNTFGVYFFMSWLPVLMKQSGLSMQWSMLSTVLLNGGGAIGTVAMGVLIDRLGIFKVVTWSYLIGALAIAAIGLGGGPAVLVPALFFTGTCMMGTQITMYAVAAMVYPTAIRATGVGTTMGWGRAGSICGPLLGTAFVALHWSISADFLVALIPIFLGALFVFVIGRLPKNFGTETHLNSSP